MRVSTCTLARLDTELRTPFAARHVEACLQCQAVAARDRRLLRELRALRDVVEAAPDAMATRVEARIASGAVTDHATDGVFAPVSRRSVAWRPELVKPLAAAGAVTAAAVGAAAVFLRRRGHSVA